MTQRSSRLGPNLLVAALCLGLAVACGTAQEDDDLAATDANATTTETTGADTATSTSVTAAAENSAEELFPDVLEASATLDGDGTWSFSATLSSPYDSAARYADAWRVMGPDGEVFGIRELAHDHGAEQPFTRSQAGIAIPEGVDTVTVQGRDQISGWGGATATVELDR